jgi:hypothetical protein
MGNPGPYIVIGVFLVITSAISYLISRKREKLVFLVPVIFLILSALFYAAVSFLSSGWDGLIYAVLSAGSLAVGVLSLIFSVVLFIVRRKNTRDT